MLIGRDGVDQSFCTDLGSAGSKTLGMHPKAIARAVTLPGDHKSSAAEGGDCGAFLAIGGGGVDQRFHTHLSPVGVKTLGINAVAV